MVKFQLTQTFFVSTITNGDDKAFDEKEAIKFFKNCDIIEVSSQIRKFVKLREFIFSVKLRINMEDFKLYLQENYSHHTFRRPQSGKEYLLFQKSLQNYCSETFCGDFGMWKVALNNS